MLISITRNDLNSDVLALLDALPEPYLVCAPDGTLLHANPRAIANVGVNLSLFLGQNLTDFANSRTDVRDGLTAALSTSEPLPMRLHLRFGGKDVDLAGDAQRFALKRGELTVLFRLTSHGEKVQRYTEFNEILAETRARLHTERQHRAEIEAVNEKLKRFAAVAAHDIKSPIAQIFTFSQMVEAIADPPLTGKALEYLGYIRQSSKRLSALIDDLLAHARTGSERLDLVECCLEDVVYAIKSDLLEKIDETNATVRISSLPTVRADANQLRRLFQNLIENALKYRHPDRAPEVSVYCKSDGTTHTICVADNGLGFTDEDAAKLFEPFTRLKKKGIQGTGLGLATCRDIAERHNWRISASGVEGEGARFEISIPA